MPPSPYPDTTASPTAPSSAEQNTSHTTPARLGRPNAPSSRTSIYSHAVESFTRRYRRTPRDVAKRLFDQPSSPSTPKYQRPRPASVAVCPSANSPFASGSQSVLVEGAGRVTGAGTAPANNNAFVTPVAASPHNCIRSERSGRTGRSERRRHASLTDAFESIHGPHAAAAALEKPQASASGGAVTMTIQLAEPMLFLQGMDHNEYSQIPAMLRGTLLLRVAKPTKIKSISLTFRGRARTDWPEGIPPKKAEYHEEKELMQHTWPFFNAHFPVAELGPCADSYRPRLPANSSSECNTIIGSAISHLAPSTLPVAMPRATAGATSDNKPTLRITRTKSFSKDDSRPTVAQRGYRVFEPGEYAYNFELALESCMPETINVDLGSVRYELAGCIERHGTFRSNLTGKKEVTLVRVPAEANLERTEPIAISRTWEDQLHYDIVISGKSFPLGTAIPISFKLTPLAKVRCHRIKVFVAENIEYSCKNKKVHRLDSSRKILLFEKRAEAPAIATFEGSTVKLITGGGIAANDRIEGGHLDVINGTDNLLGDLTTGSPNIGPTEMEFNIQLPGCNAKDRDKLHFDTSYQNIHVHHWIKIVMRLSKQDPNHPSKRRHFEISIDSPFQILSCRATNANTQLPAYHRPGADSGVSTSPALPCQCSNNRRSPPEGLRSQQAPPYIISSVNAAATRIHTTDLFRLNQQPPPPFDADVPPPPLLSPPPSYENVIGRTEGLADYFARLADDTVEDDAVEEDLREARRRTLPPLTPGGRVARSMDEMRLWEPIGRV